MKMKAFTLIELLIVVAIIAILAAIAVPNFLEAQTRSKVARVKADMRSLATAIEAYAVDYNTYPPNDAGTGPNSQFRMNRIVCLTTPVAFMTSLPKDPFLPGATVVPGASLDAFQYFNYDYRYKDANVKNFYGFTMVLRSWGHIVAGTAGTYDVKGCVIKSWGPDAGKPNSAFGPSFRGDSGAEWSVYGFPNLVASIRGIDMIYDPTNGTISAGDVIRFAGGVNMPQVPN